MPPCAFCWSNRAVAPCWAPMKFCAAGPVSEVTRPMLMGLLDAGELPTVFGVDDFVLDEHPAAATTQPTAKSAATRNRAIQSSPIASSADDSSWIRQIARMFDSSSG